MNVFVACLEWGSYSDYTSTPYLVSKNLDTVKQMQEGIEDIHKKMDALRPKREKDQSTEDYQALWEQWREVHNEEVHKWASKFGIDEDTIPSYSFDELTVRIEEVPYVE